MKPNTVIQGDALEVLKGMPPDYFDSCVTDPPYELGFMGKAWDKSGVAYSVDLWREVLRVLKPGAHLLSFGGSRTHHRLFCAVEDAGFEIRDTICWIFGSGFPKSLDISKAIDKAAGKYVPGDVLPSSRQSAPSETGIATSFRTKNGTNPQTDAARQWEGWGTALKPAHEPIVVARKPFRGTVADNVQRYGTGGINVDGGRIETEDVRPLIVSKNGTSKTCFGNGINNSRQDPEGTTQGRFPANVIHDGSEEVVRLFPETSSGEKKAGTPYNHANCNTMGASSGCVTRDFPSDNGSAARFFYAAKASRAERNNGLDSTRTVKYNVPIGGALCKDVTTALVESLKKATSELTVTWLIEESGESITALCPSVSLSTILTAISKITTSQILHSLTPSLISACTQAVSCETENGGSPAGCVESSSGLKQTTTNESPAESPRGASRVVSEMLLTIKNGANWKPLNNFHPTVKPLSLIQYLVKLVTPPGGIVLDPFMGSGTLGIAAGKLGMKWVGIEKIQLHIEIAERRIEREVGLLLDVEDAPC